MQTTQTKIKIAYYKTLMFFTQGFLNVITWFKANKATIYSLLGDIWELLLMVMILGNVYFGTLLHAGYYLALFLISIVLDIRRYTKKALSRKAEIDFSMDSDFLKSMVHGYVNRCGYDLVKKPDTEEVDEFERTHGHKKGFRPTKK